MAKVSFVTGSFLPATPAQSPRARARTNKEDKPRSGVSVPERSLHFGPETSVTSPLRWRWIEYRGHEKRYIQSSRPGNVGILKGFPKSVGRVGSRHHGFPCFPYSVISMACFLPGDAGFTATSTSATRRARHETLIVISCR